MEDSLRKKTSAGRQVGNEETITVRGFVLGVFCGTAKEVCWWVGYGVFWIKPMGLAVRWDMGVFWTEPIGSSGRLGMQYKAQRGESEMIEQPEG